MANDPRNPSGPGAPAPDFLAGLDAFSRKIDEEQKAHERAEAERRRREEEEARRRAEAERVRQAEAQAQRKAEAEKHGGGPRFAALEMLRKQAASRPAGEDTASRRSQGAHSQEPALGHALPGRIRKGAQRGAPDHRPPLRVHPSPAGLAD